MKIEGHVKSIEQTVWDPCTYRVLVQEGALCQTGKRRVELTLPVNQAADFKVGEHVIVTVERES